jgi:protein SCO1/2
MDRLWLNFQMGIFCPLDYRNGCQYSKNHVTGEKSTKFSYNPLKDQAIIMYRIYWLKSLLHQVTGLKGCLVILFCLVPLLALQSGCQQQEPLPILTTISTPYTFTDQDGTPVSQQLFNGKIYVADFFFTSCPTICPIMKTQMLRIYEAFSEQDDLLLLSHTIDPTHDSVEVLHDFARRLGVSAKRWHLVTGPKNQIYETALLYGLGAAEDKNAPGGFIHSGSFCLIDRQGRIRGYYKGTEEEAVDRLIKDIRRLLNET